MGKNRIYIMPTSFGAVFVFGSTLMILIGAAYQNNLVNMLAFFMLSLIFTSMIQTHNNLKGLRLNDVESDGGFANSNIVLTSIVSNETPMIRFNLESGYKKTKTIMHYDPGVPLLAKSTLRLKTSHTTKKRGVYKIDSVKISSAYPLGLFRAWIWLPVNAEYHVFPTPEGKLPMPFDEDPIDEGRLSRPKSGDDFHGHRRFFKGDSQRRVDWKAFARGRPLLVKEFTDGAPRTACLDWNSLEGLEVEERLSQLSKWIDEAVRKKSVFSMRIPGASVPSGQGRGHAIRCWKLLAEFQK